MATDEDRVVQELVDVMGDPAGFEIVVYRRRDRALICCVQGKGKRLYYPPERFLSKQLLLALDHFEEVTALLAREPGDVQAD